MKISFIKSCLANYDTKKGFLRVLRDESHIGDLRTFFNQDLGGDKAVDRDLTPEELHELVAIALKKKNWNASQSADTFGEIFKQFGGIEAYQYLLDKNALTASNVAFLEKNAALYSSREIAGLAVLVDYSSQSVPPLSLSVLSDEVTRVDLGSMNNRVDCMSRLKKDGLLSKNALLLIARGMDVEMAEQLIRLMNAQNSFNDVNLQSLSEHPEALEPIFQILTTLGKKEVFPAKFCDVTKIFSFNVVAAKNFNFYLQAIAQQCQSSKTTASPETGNKLLAHREVLENQKPDVMEKVLAVFQMREWKIADYLDYLFAINEVGLQFTVTHMAKLPLETGYLTRVLDALKVEGAHYRTIVKGITLLKEKNALTEENLCFILNSCQHANTLAAAVTQWPDLKEKKIAVAYTELLKCPSFADKVVSALLELSKVIELTEQVCTLVMSKPESAEAARDIFHLLRSRELSDKKMVDFLYQTKVINRDFYKAIAALDEANILTSTNVIKLCLKAAYIRTIASACATLHNANALVKELKPNGSCSRLNQTLFDAIIDDPLNALKLAESSGGRLTRLGISAMKDEGACDFVRIRQGARYLALMQHQGLLFGPYLMPEVNGNKKPYTLEERQALEKKSVLHIASFLGSGFLEKAVEEHVAKESVEDIFKLNAS